MKLVDMKPGQVAKVASKGLNGGEFRQIVLMLSNGRLVDVLSGHFVSYPPETVGTVVYIRSVSEE